MSLVMPKPKDFNTWSARSRAAWYHWWCEDTQTMRDRIRSDALSLRFDSDPRAYAESVLLLKRWHHLTRRANRYTRRAYALKRALAK